MTGPRRFTANLILDSAPEGILCLDLEGRIVFANLSAVRLLGYQTADDLVGQPIWSHMQFLEAPSGTVMTWREDGSSISVEYATSPMLDNEHIAGTVVSFHDVTTRCASEHKKDELISTVSHELRTPLTAIRSALGLLVGGAIGPLPETGRRMLEIGVKNTDRLIRLVNDILDLERLESGESTMTIAPCRVDALLRDAVDGVRTLADDAAVAIEVGQTDAQLRADADRMVQVLINLLGNAIKFSPRGGSVWLDADQAAGEVVLRVRDQGRGIPRAKMDMIFERFAQVEPGDRRDKGGTGLGLAICRTIVEQHGGQIWAESTAGLGTTMCIALPSDEMASSVAEAA